MFSIHFPTTITSVCLLHTTAKYYDDADMTSQWAYVIFDQMARSTNIYLFICIMYYRTSRQTRDVTMI